MHVLYQANSGKMIKRRQQACCKSARVQCPAWMRLPRPEENCLVYY